MHERALRNTMVAGLATTALLLGTAGCTSGGSGEGKNDKQDKAAACTQGTYAWSGVERVEKLTGLADPITFRTKKTASVAVDIKLVDSGTYKPHMTSTAPGVRAADAIKALGRYLRTDEPLADPSAPAEPADDGGYYSVHEGEFKGSYYAWSYIGLVEADFTYTCRGGGAEPIQGHVLTWDDSGSGFMSCGDPIEDGALPTSKAAERAAAAKLCPADSPAAKSA